MSVTKYRHHIDTIKGEDYVLHKDYTELMNNLENEIDRLNNIISELEKWLNKIMEEQITCYKKYPEDWKNKTSVSNTWLTSRDCYWSTLNKLDKLKELKEDHN